MTPTPIEDGSRTRDEMAGEERDFAEHRFAALAQAVRQHEGAARRHVAPAGRAHDRHLYRRLREICGEQSGR